MMRSVACPTCGKRVQWSEAQRWRPFCSQRCRLIDLGDWLSDVNSISEDVSHERGALLTGYAFPPISCGRTGRNAED